MTNKLRNWLLKISPNRVRTFVWVFCFSIVILRFFFETFRKGFDTLSIILIAVGFLAILKENFYELLKQMEFVGLPGTKIPTELKENMVLYDFMWN